MGWRTFAIRVPLILCLLPTPGARAKKKPPARPVNSSTATSDELQQVPGIGPATAEKILQMRKSYGAFKSVDDLLAIRGLGPKRLEKNAQIFDRWEACSRKARPVTGKDHSSGGKAARQTMRERLALTTQ